MKTSKKVLAILLALALVSVFGLTAFAKTVSAGSGPATITISLPDVGDRTANNTYKVYKVFDAENDGESDAIVYKLVSGKTTPPAGFTADANGYVSYAGAAGTTELTQNDIDNIASYVRSDTPVVTVNTTNADKEIVITGLDYGYYYITTTTGTLVTVDSTNPNAEVKDKNEVPPVDKKITGAHYVDADGQKALAQIGENVTFTATITKKAGAENYEFHDKMTSGLVYNNDLIVTVNGATVTQAPTTYTVGADTGDTLTVRFNNTYIEGLADDTVITFTYTAKITESAVTLDPEKNTAYLTYGDVTGENSTPIKEVEVYNATISVNKTDDSNKPLAGADFVLKNSENKYYKLDNGVVTWVNSIDDADVHTSAADGTVPAFTGLADGTYALVETKAPTGYNKAEDTNFTIKGGDYTAANLEQTATVVNNKGPELPSTGGIGTTIFYIVGSVLLLAAAIVLIARRRTAADVA